MTIQSFLSEPALQKAVPGLICGILLGISHNISRRLLEAAAVIAALAILFFMITNDGSSLMEVDYTVITGWLTLWKFELVGAIVGIIIGYSIVTRPNHGETKS